MQDGEEIEYGDGNNDSLKHNLKQNGDKYIFSINSLCPEDSGLYQMDVEDANMFSTELEGKTKFDLSVNNVKATIFNGKISVILKITIIFKSYRA